MCYLRSLFVGEANCNDLIQALYFELTLSFVRSGIAFFAIASLMTESGSLGVVGLQKRE